MFVAILFKTGDELMQDDAGPIVSGSGPKKYDPGWPECRKPDDNA
ncbi:hypothetical protein EBBID32_28030 [Sphingobium indicum BiD32]|uniref:Uncharacterized protein n=1 Tax=Sphingobium indicum BiD32 TaxID=1301087 RepID=N1MMK3_9SPHN|nr:hypothetical protein EBBID32_28030 [Sphingobium indicum BiD32]